MSNWVTVEFWAQVPDGMQISEVDPGRTAETLARAFGFTRVSHLSFGEVTDGLASLTRKLVDDRPSEGTSIWPSH